MKKAFYFLLLFVSSISFLSCDDDDKKTTNPIDQLPPITQTGKNTFGCLINGEPFIVRNTYDQVAMHQGGGLFIGGGNDFNDLSSHISMLVGESITEGHIYTLNTSTSPKGEYYINTCFYFTTPIYTGTLEITHFDQVNYIISGKFEFQAIADNCGNEEVINVTDGRFDLEYIP